jgi:hypothetical protein
MKTSTRNLAIASAIAVSLAPAITVAQPDTDPDPDRGPVATTVKPKPTEPKPADREPADEAAQAPSDEHTAADVADAPIPGREHGLIAGTDGGDGAGRIIARGILFVPRLALELAFAPVRAGIWVESEYHLSRRAKELFFDETNTYGIYPTARFESGSGVTLGARFVHRNLFGHKEHLAVFGGGGGRYRQIGAVSLRTGDLLGSRLTLETEGLYEKRPKDPFWGIGNGDAVAAPGMPIDTFNDDTAVRTRYRSLIQRVAAVADLHVVGDLHVRATGALLDQEIGVSDDGPPIDQVYMPGTLTGFDGVRSVYSELELRWDDRGRASRYEPPSILALGGLTGFYVGRTHRLDGGKDFWRVGYDIQQLIRIAKGPKILILRAHGEGVSGGLDDVPFYDLPSLGGSRFLRGYSRDRFRDRLAVVGSVEYQWDLLRTVSAGLFVDAGKVYRSVHHLDVDNMRMGYGAELQWFGERSLWVRAAIASSIDGGLEFYLTFDPVTDLDRRVERR